MNFRNSLAPILLAGALSTGLASAQEIYKSEASVQAFGSFTATTWNQGVKQNATDAGGVLASYRYFFNNYNGIELNYGFASGTQKYNYFGSVAATPANSDEATAAWIIRYPGHRVVPFGLLGTGALVFNPQNIGFETLQARAAFVYGGGIDVGLGNHYFMRAEYRGFVYDSPDFDSPFLGPDRTTHRAEPSIGFGVKW